MKRAFISDFDGTLRLYGEQGAYVLQEDIDAIQAFQKAGNLFGICSGRPLAGLLAVLPKEMHPDFCIVSSGAAITEGIDEVHFLTRKPIEAETAEKLLTKILALGKVYVQTDRDLCTFGKPGEAMPEDIQTILERLEDVRPFCVLGISIGMKDERSARVLCEEVNQEFAGKLKAFQNINYLDIVRADCSKGTGIEEARQHYALDHLYGIGDSYNDIPLLDASDTAFTFHRSPESVQAHADHVVDTVAEALRIAEKSCLD